MNGKFQRYLCAPVALVGCLLLTSACTSTTCSRAETDETVEFSPSMITDGVYYSAPYGGPYQHFPGGRTLHFKHNLNKVPLPPTFWLAFSVDGALSANPLAQSAGNMAELVGLDTEEIAVKNDTCSDFYIWFYAMPEP